MKNLNKIISLAILVICLVSCKEDDPSFGEVIAPSNIVITSQIVGQDAEHPFGDGSGKVNFSVTADNASSFRFMAPNVPSQDATSGNAQIQFASSAPGVYIYQLTVVAFGTGGTSSLATAEVEVFVEYTIPPDLLEKLVGEGSRTWRIKSEKDKHFGLGPPGGTIPFEYYGAGPEEKAGVGMYDDRYVFSVDLATMENKVFQHITDNTNDDPTNNPSGTVFGRGGLVQELGGPGGGEVQGGDILNYPLSDYTADWGINEVDGVETISLSGTGFIGYYTGGNHQYQIFNRAEPDELTLVTLDGNGEFSWWFIITSAEPGEEGFTSIYNNLVWEEPFDVDGAPNPSNWTYDLGAGGWGNNESQTYTNDAENVIVEDGTLKITAINEGGGNYSSARIKSENLYEFTYGRVEVRAKLPTGGGTWPAIWMLGANYDTNAWPACGEIDIMEHVGNQQNTIHSTLHFPGNSGGDGVSESTNNPTASTEFHNYSVEWKADEILFLIDTVVYHTFANNASIPFNSNFFIILNVAMGGNFGGDIDPDFVESAMEIDYVRVYQ